MSERHIFLGMPGYGNQTAAAGRSYWLACKDFTDGRRCPGNKFRDKVTQRQQIGSLLAANMNSLWANALTMRHRGERVDYFAMLHDDIGCEDCWLDKLIDELEENDLDILGVVSPIKDRRGVTSTAIADKDGDPWSVVRLTMHEVYRLPPTFTSEDVGGDLLLNTGCWVCRFDKFAEYPFYFTINDQITFDKKLNAYIADVESEDWFFSRLCHKAGMKVGATRKIALFHEGHAKYTNVEPWGTDRFDMSAVKESPIPERQDGFRFPGDVDGWLAFVEGEALFNLVRGKRVLEIGSYCGRSTICLAQSAESVISIDYFDGRGTPNPRDTYQECCNNLKRYGVLDKVQLCNPDDPVIGEEFDLVFIDGDHSYDKVCIDIEAAKCGLGSSGLIAFHDYRAYCGDKGVKQAVDELIADGGEILSIHGTIAVVRPPAAIPLEV